MSQWATSNDAGSFSQPVGVSDGAREAGTRGAVPVEKRKRPQEITSEAVLRSPSTPNIKTAFLEFRLARDSGNLSEALDIIRNRRVY
jgi:hypothetical protein